MSQENRTVEMWAAVEIWAAREKLGSSASEVIFSFHLKCVPRMGKMGVNT